EFFFILFFLFHPPPTPETSPLSLHDALPIWSIAGVSWRLHGTSSLSMASTSSVCIRLLWLLELGRGRCIVVMPIKASSVWTCCASVMSNSWKRSQRCSRQRRHLLRSNGWMVYWHTLSRFSRSRVPS